MPVDVTITALRCPHAAEHKTDKNILLLERPDGTLFCAIHGDIWKNQHAPDCEVTKQRSALLADMTETPESPYLTGAFVEYDGGGDQEVELCDCGFEFKRTWTPTAEDWARYGARPMTREEVATEKRAIDEARRNA